MLRALLIIVCSVVVYMLLLGVDHRGIAQSRKAESLEVAVRVERGIEYSGHPLSHLVNLQSWEISGLPSLESLSPFQRQEVAQKELRAAIKAWKPNSTRYSLGQIYSFLGFSECKLANLFRTQVEPSDRTKYDRLSKIYFAGAANSYRKAIKHSSYDLRYQFAVQLVRCETSSGDAKRAFDSLLELDRLNLKPSLNRDFELLRIRGDLFWEAGKLEEAARAYEEWISKGSTEAVIRPGGEIYHRLLNLKSRTGRPRNFVPLDDFVSLFEQTGSNAGQQVLFWTALLHENNLRRLQSRRYTF